LAVELFHMRKEIHNYLSASQSLIAVALTDHEPFSDEEVRMVTFYMDQIGKILGPSIKRYTQAEDNRQCER
jgi:hypothetical protein